VKVTPTAGPQAGRDRAEKSFYTLPDYLTWKAGVMAGRAAAGAGGKAAAAGPGRGARNYWKG